MNSSSAQFIHQMPVIISHFRGPLKASDFIKLQRAYLIQFLSTPLPVILRGLLFYCYKAIIRIVTLKYFGFNKETI